VRAAVDRGSVVLAASGPRRGRAAALAVLVLALVAGALLAPGRASAAPDQDGVRAVTLTTAPLVPGQSAWVSVVWAADRTVDHWSTTVTAPAGVGVTYPTTRGGSDTSLYGSATLVGGTQDFTAFRLVVPYAQRTSFAVTVTSTYTSTCGDNGQCKDQGAGNDDKVRSGSTTATVQVPVVAATGAAFTQRTTQLSVAAGSDSFQQIDFTGGQADLTGFTVQAGTLPAGLQVAYPADGTASGLAASSTLVGGKTDHVAIRVTATHLAPGTYRVPLVIRYTAAAPHTASGTVTLVVT
jgi:hypothetical protein